MSNSSLPIKNESVKYLHLCLFIDVHYDSLKRTCINTFIFSEVRATLDHVHAYFDVLIMGFKKPGMCKMDTPNRMNCPSSMETPHISWLFDECLDKSDMDDVFDGAVLEN